MTDYVPPVTSGARPHRGTLILVLGIVGIVMTCFPLGIVAWVMGSSDLAAMDRGEIDPSGRGTTQAGKVCGIISVILSALALIWVAFVVIAAIGMGAAAAQ